MLHSTTPTFLQDGYSGVEVRVTPQRTEIIIRATRTKEVLGDKGRRIKELTSVVQKRFNFPDNGVELYAERVVNRGLSAIAQVSLACWLGDHVMNGCCQNNSMTSASKCASWVWPSLDCPIAQLPPPYLCGCEVP